MRGRLSSLKYVDKGQLYEATILKSLKEDTTRRTVVLVSHRVSTMNRGMYSVYPVEYKKGKEKSTDADRLQLVAQVLCLEEMFSATIPEAALFYGETRRREVVEITEDLRNAVKDIFEEMHQYYNRGYTPKVKTGKMCNSCSLKELCLPKLNKQVSVKHYIDQMLKEEET